MRHVELEDEEHEIVVRVLKLIDLAFVQEKMQDDNDEEVKRFRSAIRKLDDAQ